MSLREALRSALSALRANRLRSALTTLGIVIGVTAVIVLVALGNGITTGFNESFGALGTQIIVTKTDGSVPGGGVARDLTDADVDALRDRRAAPDIQSVTPVVTGTALLEAGTGQFRSSVAGSTADYVEVNNRDLVVGRFFTETEERSRAKVVVLGPNPVANLFAGQAGDALGREIRIGRTNFQVIGVLASDGQQDNVVVLPVGVARSYLLGGGDEVGQLIVKATATEAVPAALEQVNTILSERHGIRDPAERDFDARALQSLLDNANQFLSFLSLFTVAIAAISLIVGGIGVANIMLVSVTERTREIGIRKAIGATRTAILRQFLIESTVLAALGGIIGIVLGVGLALAGAAILPAAVPDFPPPTVSIDSIVIAFTISLVIGLVAGGYPANRAAKLRPIEALRFQ
ncbi:MAG: ABC transporter permease [Pseudonocardia sp.]